MELSGGRGAPGAMQREGITRRYVLWQRRIPCDDLKRADKVKPRCRQRRHMQRLANMAGRIGPIRMLVEQGAARCKIEQRSASQKRQRATRSVRSEDSSPVVHRATVYLSTSDGRQSSWLLTTFQKL